MSFTSSIGAAAAARLMTIIAVGALSTAGAGVGMAVALTGSTSPSAWLAAYEHSRECRAEGEAQDPKCSTEAAQALAANELAQKLEQEAQHLKAKPSPASNPSATPSPPDPATPPPPPEGSDG